MQLKVLGVHGFVFAAGLGMANNPTIQSIGTAQVHRQPGALGKIKETGGPFIVLAGGTVHSLVRSIGAVVHVGGGGFV